MLLTIQSSRACYGTSDLFAGFCACTFFHPRDKSDMAFDWLLKFRQMFANDLFTGKPIKFEIQSKKIQEARWRCVVDGWLCVIVVLY